MPWLVCAVALAACKPDPKCGAGARLDGNACIRLDPEVDAGQGDAGSSCPIDADGDGFAALDATGPCTDVSETLVPGDCDDNDPDSYPDAPVNRCDQSDNDCDGKVEAPVAEVCNGLDDDCQDGVDNGVDNACGSCGELPAETCNWVDDDCDGVADPGALVRLPGQRVFTRASESATFNATLLAIPRAEEGAWLLYAGQPSLGTAAVAAQRLDANGAVQGAPLVLTSTEGSDGFVADVSGPWVVIASVRRPLSTAPQNDTAVLRVQLYRSADLALVDQVDVLSHEDDDDETGDTNDANDCNDLALDRVVVHEARDGSLAVATLYDDIAGYQNGQNCAARRQTYFHVVTRTADGTWQRTVDRTLLDSLQVSDAVMASVPCRDEWLLLRTVASNPGGLRFSLDGTPLAPFSAGLLDVGTIVALDRATDACPESGESTLLFSYGKTSTNSTTTSGRIWGFDAAGVPTPRGEEFEIAPRPANAVKARQVGGRWFVAGTFRQSLSLPQNTRPELFEISAGDAPTSRAIALVVDQGAEPGSLGRDGSLAPTGGALVTGFAAAFQNSLEDWREPGDTDQPVGITYTLGCPP